MPVDYSIELRLAYLRAAQAAQEETEADIRRYRDFYAGAQEIELTDRQKEYLDSNTESLANICKRVVGVVKDRLVIDEAGIMPADGASQQYADLVSEWWTAENLDSLQKEIYEASLRDGSVAVIVGWDDVAGRPSFTPNLLYDGETGLVRFHYDQDDELLFASKRWSVWNPLQFGETGKRRLTVYRPDLIERFESEAGRNWRTLQPQEIVPPTPNPQYWTEDGGPNGMPLGIPVIPFENPSGSELTDVIVLQQLLNHSLSTFNIANDYHGFPIIWTVGAHFPIDSTTGKAKIPKFQPGMGIDLPDGGSVNRLEPAQIREMFEAGVLSYLEVLAIVKGWPLFALRKSGDVPSGIALQIAENGLVNQVIDKQRTYSGAWKRAFEMARKIYNLQTGSNVQGQIDLTWQTPRTEDSKADAETKQIRFEAGKIPTLQRWRELGYTQAEIDQMIEDAGREDEIGFVPMAPEQ